MSFTREYNCVNHIVLPIRHSKLSECCANIYRVEHFACLDGSISVTVTDIAKIKKVLWAIFFPRK